MTILGEDSCAIGDADRLSDHRIDPAAHHVQVGQNAGQLVGRQIL